MKPLLLSAGMGVFILLALGLRALAGKRLPARIFCASWTLCAVRLLIPAALPCKWSFWALFSRAIPASIVPAAQQISSPAIALSPSAPLRAAATAQTSQSASLPWLTIIWGVGAALMLGWFALGYIRMVRAMRAATPANLGAQWCRECGFSFHRKISVRILNDVRAPLTYGVFRPVVILPPNLMEEDAKRRLALTHELVHVRRFDCLRKLLFALALCTHWMNPMVWLMVRAANRDLELACDEQALAQLGMQSRKAYCLMLLELADRKPPCVPLGNAFGQSAAEERIRRMMNPKKMSMFTIVLALTMLLLSFTVLATQTPNVKLTPASPAAAQSAEEKAENISASDAQEREKISAPSKEDAPSGKIPAETDAQTAQAPSWLWPCADRSATISDSFGARVHPLTGQVSYHYGTDLAAAYDAAVYAMQGGTVAEAGYSPAAGYHVIIDHAGGFQSVYQHLHTLSVQAGDSVLQGDTVGTVGSSGWATGTHLHIAILKDGEYLDPMQFLS